MRSDIDTSPQSRSRITNGQGLLHGVSGRSVWARRMRDLIQLHTSDAGGGDELSEAERSIIRRIATLTIELEFMEATFATLRETSRAPNADQLDLYSRLSGQLRRLLETIGIQRRARDVSASTAPQGGALEGYLIEGDSR